MSAKRCLRRQPSGDDSGLDGDLVGETRPASPPAKDAPVAGIGGPGGLGAGRFDIALGLFAQVGEQR